MKMCMEVVAETVVMWNMKVYGHNKIIPIVVPFVLDSSSFDFAATVVAGGNYYPFDSCAQALLFMLTNSPRPLVYIHTCSVIILMCLQGESNLNFILFMLGTLNLNVPGIIELKKFRLPIFNPPTEVNKIFYYWHLLYYFM